MDTDKLIDAALSRYAEAPPTPGLEQRVLNRIRVAQAARRRSRYVAAVCIGLAAGLVLVLASIRTRPTVTAKIAPEIASVASAPAQPLASEGRVRTANVGQVSDLPVSGREIQKSTSDGQVGDLPHTARHPTREELALVTLVERYPEEVQLALADIAPTPVEPIEIKPIDIQPLPGSEPH